MFFCPISKTWSGWSTLLQLNSWRWTRTSNSPLTLKKAPKLENPFTSAFLIISPSLYFATSLALSSFLKEDIISLLDTHAFPLILSSLINLNFCGSFIKWLMSLRGLSLIWLPGRNIKDPVSICSTIHPPLHFDVILPIIGSSAS